MSAYDTEPSTGNTLQIPTADIIRLIDSYLTDQGLHQTASCLRKESGIGGAAAPATISWETWANSGQWGLVLQQVANLDRQRSQVDAEVINEVHQMAVLELADQNEWELAYSTFRTVQGNLDLSKLNKRETRAAFVSRKLNELAVIRNKDKDAKVPDDFYGAHGLDEMRRKVGAQLRESIPSQPPDRLIILLQQAVKWQSYTGDLPRSVEDNDSVKKRKVFDLVRGTCYADPVVVGSSITVPNQINEPLVQRRWQKLKFAKNTAVTAATFSPDASSLFVGTSDGFIEIYEGPTFKALKDLPYQSEDECLTIDSRVTALAVSRDATLLAAGSSDGKVNVYKVESGQCLRSFQAFEQHSNCLGFSADSSHLLIGGPSACREFGLRANRMLQDLSSPATVINCFYWRDQIITGTNDGMVRLHSKSDCVAVWNPHGEVEVGQSVVASATQSEAAITAPAIISLIPLRWRGSDTDQDAILILNRSNQACVVDGHGIKILVIRAASGILAGTVSPSHRLLYLTLETNNAVVVDLHTGEDIQSTEIGYSVSSMFHHPLKPIIGMFDDDENQTRGVLHLWK